MNKLISILVLSVLVLTGCGDSFSNPSYIKMTSNSSTVNATVFGATETGLQALEIDGVSKALVVIPTGEDELHDGDFFSYTTVQNLTGNGNLTVLFKTPPTYMIHWTFSVTTVGEASFQIYEGGNVSANGTPQVPINHDRASNTTALSQVFLTPTITNIGNLLAIYHWGNGKTTGGAGTGADEWMLAPNTTYIFRITNETVSAQYASIDIAWYKHD